MSLLCVKRVYSACAGTQVIEVNGNSNMAEERRRFQLFSREEIKDERSKQVNTVPKNTVKANQKAARASRKFLNEGGTAPLTKI